MILEDSLKLILDGKSNEVKASDCKKVCLDLVNAISSLIMKSKGLGVEEVNIDSYILEYIRNNSKNVIGINNIFDAELDMGWYDHVSFLD